MINEETYKRELSRYFNSIRDDVYKDEIEGFADCAGVSCRKCMFKKYETCETEYTLDIIESLEKWLNEHPQKKYKVSQVEYDILKSFKESNLYSKFYFTSSLVTRNLLKLGYFEGADEYMKIKDYFDNCEVKDE